MNHSANLSASFYLGNVWITAWMISKATQRQVLYLHWVCISITLIYKPQGPYCKISIAFSVWYRAIYCTYTRDVLYSLTHHICITKVPPLQLTANQWQLTSASSVWKNDWKRIFLSSGGWHFYCHTEAVTWRWICATELQWRGTTALNNRDVEMQLTLLGTVTRRETHRPSPIVSSGYRTGESAAE